MNDDSFDAVNTTLNDITTVADAALQSGKVLGVPLDEVDRLAIKGVTAPLRLITSVTDYQDIREVGYGPRAAFVAVGVQKFSASLVGAAVAPETGGVGGVVAAAVADEVVKTICSVPGTRNWFSGLGLCSSVGYLNGLDCAAIYCSSF